MALILPILMQVILVVTVSCSDRYILSLFPHLHTPFPSILPVPSFMVSVDVKAPCELTYGLVECCGVGSVEGLGS